MDKKEYLRQYRIANKGKTKRYFVTVTSKEAERFEAKAEREGMKPSTYLQRLLIADINQSPHIAKEVTEELQALRFLVSTIANNVNQIAHHSNVIKSLVDENDLLQELKKLERAVTEYTAGKFKHDY